MVLRSKPVWVSKARSEPGATAPAKTTPLATDDAPTPGGPFCSHGTVCIAGSNACMVGCCSTVSRGSVGSQTPDGLPSSPKAVAPYTRWPSKAVEPMKPPEKPPKTTRDCQTSWPPGFRVVRSST